MKKNINKDFIAKMAEDDCRSGIETFAKTIKLLRTEAKMSMADLYKLSGVSSSTINDVEKAKYFPRIDVIFKLGYALELTKYEILCLLMGTDINEIEKHKSKTTFKSFLENFGADKSTVNEIIDFVNFKLKGVNKSEQSFIPSFDDDINRLGYNPIQTKKNRYPQT